MLQMRIVRSPLPDADNRVILGEYNRLTRAGIPIEEFLRWVQECPGGPAWHAILNTEEGRIVGHTSVLPLTAQYRGSRLPAAMSEYSFLNEDFRKLKILGYENVSRPPFITLLDQLFQHCMQEGWGPLFASTNEKNQLFTRKVGLRPVEFPLTECLLVLKPVGAARHTPNISGKQRLALFAAGVAQKSMWSIASHLFAHRNGIRQVPVENANIRPETERLSFYEEADSYRWRYLPEQYTHYELSQDPSSYLVAKRGRVDRYLRICQYRLGSGDSVPSVVQNLVHQARAERAMGIRWAVYDDGARSEEIVSRLRRLGFVCARRVRIVMVHKNFPEYLQTAPWRMNDSNVSFDP